jgi:hypothetical protein
VASKEQRMVEASIALVGRFHVNGSLDDLASIFA